MKKKSKIVLILLIIIGLFLLADHVLTWLGVNFYGIITELNPIMKPIINNLNLILSVAVKLLYYCVLAYIIYRLDKKKPNKKTPYILCFVAIVYMGVVVYHCLTWVMVVVGV